MSRDKRYQRLLNDKRWQDIRRQVFLRTKGLCEDCKEKGIITPGIDCHHIAPVETATSLQEMERLCYNIDNVRLLCIACHSATHKQMGKGTRKLAKERATQRQERWADNIVNRFIKPSDTDPTPTT